MLVGNNQWSEGPTAILRIIGQQSDASSPAQKKPLPGKPLPYPGE